MTINRSRVVAQATPTISAAQPCPHVRLLLTTFAIGLCGPVRRTAGIVRRLTLLWLFALPLLAHAVVQAPSPVAGPLHSHFAHCDGNPAELPGLPGQRPPASGDGVKHVLRERRGGELRCDTDDKGRPDQR